MKKKIMLTSVLAIGFAYPAIAETFPSNGVMLENATYENAATYSNIGVYDGTVTATAEYENVRYDVPAGTYLPVASETLIPCAEGYYCPGSRNMSDDSVFYYSETEDQGLVECSTFWPNSDEGASSDGQCYTACTLEKMGAPHATAVEGKDYYGMSDTCVITACENGYHVNVPGENPDLETILGGNRVVGYGYKAVAGFGEDYNAEQYGITEPGQIVLDYGDKGIVVGRAQCSSRAVNLNDQIVDFLPDDTGDWCYCRYDSYTPVGGVTQKISSRWQNEYNSTCGGCVAICAEILREYSVLAQTLKNPLTTCEANTINITWTDADQADIDANNAGACEYDGDIRTPVKAIKKPGKTFKGWKFQK